MIRPLRDPEPFQRYGLTIPNGILLYGPPGCGKTYSARQLAEELGYFFAEITPSEVASPYIHQSVLCIRAGPPDTEARAEMLRLHLAHRFVEDPIDVSALAETINGYAASDIKFLVDEAARDAFERGVPISTGILMEDSGGCRLL